MHDDNRKDHVRGGNGKVGGVTSEETTTTESWLLTPLSVNLSGLSPVLQHIISSQKKSPDKTPTHAQRRLAQDHQGSLGGKPGFTGGNEKGDPHRGKGDISL